MKGFFLYICKNLFMAKPKYNDFYTRKQQSKQIEKSEGIIDTSRKNRRERERRIFKFSCRVYKHIKKEIWDSIPLRIKEDIYNDWHFGFIDDSRNVWTYRTNYGELVLRYDNKCLNYNKDFYKDEFDTWLFRQIKRKTDKSTYRDILINNLLD